MSAEKQLKNAAEQMLAIIFDELSTDDEVDMSATTLVEIVAPHIMEMAAKYLEATGNERTDYHRTRKE